VLALFALALVSAVVLQHTTAHLDDRDVAEEARNLDSFAIEAELLLHRYEDGAIPTPFARVYASHIAQQMLASNNRLADAEIAPTAQERALRLAQRSLALAAAAHQIAEQPNDEVRDALIRAHDALRREGA
jgi:hypothetical protein